MTHRAVVPAACLAALALFGPGACARDSGRADLSPDRVAQGRTLFHGAGGCAQCHGVDGAGGSDGPSLTSGPWSLGDGSPDWLVHMTRHGGWGSTSPDGDPQRMRGPTVLDSAQVRLVAGYVFSISREKTPKQ